MSFSMTFNSIYLGDYGLTVLNLPEWCSQVNNFVQMPERAYPTSSTQTVKQYTVEVKIEGDDSSDLKVNLDNIKSALCAGIKELQFDWYTDRYWNAKVASLDVQLITPTVYKGQIEFDIFDTSAYAVTETNSPYTIDDPVENFTETVGGTAETYPIYILTCDDTLTGVTVSLENLTTGKKIEWTGDLVATDVLVINTEQKTIRLNGVLSVSGIGTPNFPSMLPGDNDMEVLEFSGDLNINYSARYK